MVKGKQNWLWQLNVFCSCWIFVFSFALVSNPFIEMCTAVLLSCTCFEVWTGVQSYCDLNTAGRFWDLSSGGTETRTIYLPILPAENSLWNGKLNSCSHTTGVQCDYTVVCIVLSKEGWVWSLCISGGQNALLMFEISKCARVCTQL